MRIEKTIGPIVSLQPKMRKWGCVLTLRTGINYLLRSYKKYFIEIVILLPKCDFFLTSQTRDKRRLTTKYFPRLFLGISKSTYLKVEKEEILKYVFSIM